MLTSAERRVALALVAWLAGGVALDAALAHRPHVLAPWLGPSRVADVAGAGGEAVAIPESSATDTAARRSRRPSRPARSRRALAYDERGRLDLNRADSTELELLPGVGPALASRILAARARAGRFAAVGDLLQVRGIGPRILAKLLPSVTVRAAQDSLAGAASDP